MKSFKDDVLASYVTTTNNIGICIHRLSGKGSLGYLVNHTTHRLYGPEWGADLFSVNGKYLHEFKDI